MAEITANMVGDLRAKTGAGLMDCKKALLEAKGDVEEAITILKKKGVATAAKKAGREAKEGLIHSYIHFGGRVGVLLEINCESDFVAKNEGFKELAHNICLHIAAAAPQFVDRESVSEELLEKEREIARAQAEGKPAQAVEKIVAGKLEKVYAQLCLLEQPYVKDSNITVRDLLTQEIAKIGENIVIRRFCRYQIGD
jgi:elongation factor Ts